MLLVKIIVVPLLLLLVSEISRLYGKFFGAIIAGLPMMTIPITFFITLEQGPEFGAQTALNVLPSVGAVVAYGLAFTHSVRRTPLWCALCLSSAVYFLVAWISTSVLDSYVFWLFLAFVFPPLAIYLLPRLSEKPMMKVRSRPRIPWLQMLLGASLLLIETAIAALIGPKWSAIILFFPVMSGIVSLFAYLEDGADATVEVYKGAFTGLLGSSVFVLSLTLLMPYCSIFLTFAGAIALTLTESALVSVILRRSAGG